MSANTKTYTNDFLGLISANERLIYKVCRVYESDADIRQDMFQEIVLQAWSAYPRYRRAAAFSTWLYRIALNTAITFQRKTKRNMVIDRFHLLVAKERLVGLSSIPFGLVSLYLLIDGYRFQQLIDILPRLIISIVLAVAISYFMYKKSYFDKN